MADRDLEEDVYEFLRRIQLEQFIDRIHLVLHLTRLSHFDHVTESDLTEINMSKPEQRRLFDALKKYKKEKKRTGRTRWSFKKSKKKTESSNPAPQSSPQHVQVKSCLISESSLTFLEEIGDGAFGVVYEGEWTTSNGSTLPVAVKCLKFSSGEALVKEHTDFMREASAMSDIDHPNVIHLYGVVLTTPLQLVMELAPLGSLYDRLVQEPQRFLISKLSDFVVQIASGMSYLESKRYTHRDLAARNILLASYDMVKIADFGLMRPLAMDDDIYVMNSTGKVPVAWCAPECLKNREFSLASDVWAFGITVVEIFSYGKHPWDGLGASQILELVDEPACGRPSKPNHCPDKIYSALIEHCWAHNPKERSKFSCIEAKMREAIPEDVIISFDVESCDSSEKISAQAGDIITVLAWRSRLGSGFSKGQNKRTGQVGYFPSKQVNYEGIKRKGSKSRSRVAKVKDISPPLDNSFSHCAHRGNGDTANWGNVMSLERQVAGKKRPLNLPSKLISLNNQDSDTQSYRENAVTKSNDALSVNGLDTASLASHDISWVSLNKRSWADSGYYSNRDTFVSQDYELMSGTHPIAIPGTSKQAFNKQLMPQGANVPVSFIPTPVHQFAKRNSGGSPQFDAYGGQGYYAGSSPESQSSPLIVVSSDLRPPLPAKQGAAGNHGNKGRMVPAQGANLDLKLSGEEQGDSHSYMNVNDSERGVPGGPLVPSSSPNALYSNNDAIVAFANQNFAASHRRSLPDGNSGNENDGPPTPPLPRKACGRPMFAKLLVSGNRPCPGRDCRSNSFPEIDTKRLFPGREEGKKRNSFTSLRGLKKSSSFRSCPTSPANSRKSLSPAISRKQTTSPMMSSDNWETRTAGEALDDEIYENIDSYVTMTGAAQVTHRDTPPALPLKRRHLQRRFSETREDERRTSGVALRRSGTFSGKSRPVFDSDGDEGVDFVPDFDEHPYAEITDDFLELLSLNKRSNSTSDNGDNEDNRDNRENKDNGDNRENKDNGERGEPIGCEDVPQCPESFGEISKDFATLDTICAKLQKPKEKRSMELKSNSSLNDYNNKLETSASSYQISNNKLTASQDEALWKRFSADQERLHQYSRKHKALTTSRSADSPLYPDDGAKGVLALHAQVTQVTTV